MTPIFAMTPLAVQSDARLVELARGGSERAFEALVCRYRRPLLAYARRLVGADGRAEDALQQALMGAWLALRDGAEVDEVRPWLHRIVHNCAVSMLRRAHHETVELNEALDAAFNDGSESRLAIREVLADLAALPEPQRRALLLTAISGHSHVEAAATLGLTDGAVRGLIYRARASLRRAAAALLPFGPLNWLIGSVTRRPTVVQTAEATGAASSAGVAAAVLKGGAIVATAGAIAGPALLPGPATHHRDGRRAAARQVTRRATVHRPLVAGRVLIADRLGGAGRPVGSVASSSLPVGQGARPSATRLQAGDGRQHASGGLLDNHEGGGNRPSASGVGGSGGGSSGGGNSDGDGSDHGTVSGGPVSGGSGSSGGDTSSGSDGSSGSSGGGTSSASDGSSGSGDSGSGSSGADSSDGGDATTTTPTATTPTTPATTTPTTTTPTPTAPPSGDGANPASGSGDQPAGVPVPSGDG
jgi:RNA polymerase sigma factor (sigma-70 family)